MMCVRHVADTVDLRMVRFTTSGVLDPAYSGNGLASLVLAGGSDENWSLLVDTVGRAWGAAQDADDPTRVLIYSLGADGEPNNAFSDDGRSAVRLPTQPELAGLTVSGNRLFLAGFEAPSSLKLIGVTL